MVCGDERPHLGLFVERVADTQRLDRFLESLHEPIDSRTLDQDAGAGAAVLARVAENGHRRGRGGLFDVGVREHDVGRLPAELERHPLDRLRGQRTDPFADIGRAGERDLGHVGVLDQPFAHRPACADDDVEHALRYARLQRQAFQLQRGERRQSRGLEDDRVARRERRTHLPGRDGDRKVPGHDQGDDAQRFAERHVDPARDWNGVAQEALGSTGVVVEDVDNHSDLAARVTDRLAHVARLELSQLFGAAGHGLRKAAQQLCPVAWSHGPPCGKRCLGAGHRVVGVIDSGLRDLRQHLFGRRLDDLHARNHSSARRFKTHTGIQARFEV